MSDESDYLMISGLKHFCFCRRRWALVHIEQLWDENVLTLDGHYMHERVHDADFTESRGSILLSRGMAVNSQRLRITGTCDMVELHSNPNGVEINGRDGKWTVYPVEYKRGEPDERGADEAQLCAQAMCLEEMLLTQIPEAAIYYGKTKHRQKVSLTPELRSKVVSLVTEMHQYYDRKYTPKSKMTRACKNCSMEELCQPRLQSLQTVTDYIDAVLNEV